MGIILILNSLTFWWIGYKVSKWANGIPVSFELSDIIYAITFLLTCYLVWKEHASK